MKKEMQTISDSYRKELLNQIVAKYMLRGTLPSAEQVSGEFEELLRTFPQLGNRSLISQIQEEIVPRQEISAEAFNGLLAAAKTDLYVLRDQTISSWERLLSIEKTWQSFYEKAVKTSMSINDQLDLLLFMERSIDGYLFAVKEDLLSTENIDLEETDVSIDLAVGAAVMASNTNRSYRYRVEPGKASVAVAGASGGGSTLITLTGSDPANMLFENDKNWIGYVSSRTSQPAVINILVTINTPTVLNRVDLKAVRESTPAGTIRCLYTSDGVNWGEFGSERTLSDPLVFIKEDTLVSSLRFIVTKNEPDHYRPEVGYYYYFDCSEIRMFTNSSFYTEGEVQTLISKPFIVPPFRKAGVEVCDINSEETNIRYYLSADGDNWVPVNPVNKEPAAIDYVAAFSSVTEVTNKDSSNLIDDSLGSMGILNLADYDDLKLDLANIAVINSRVEGEDVGDIDFTSFRCFQDYTELFGTPEFKGWEVTESQASTVFYVEPAFETSIDFGSSVCSINGVTVSGVYRFPGGGWYKLSCPREYWTDVRGGLSTESALESADSLYPYNVKYLIEGYNYPTGFQGSTVYKGFKSRAKRELHRATSLSSFSIREDSFFPIRDGEGRLIYLVHRPEGMPLSSAGDYLIRYNASVKENTAIVFKAEFLTENSKVSPILASFTIRVGN